MMRSGSSPDAVAVAFGQRPAVVEAEQIEAAVFRAVLDDEDHVVEPLDHVVGKLIELVDHESLESRGIHVDHRTTATSLTWGE